MNKKYGIHLQEIIEFRQNALSQFENIRRQANNISIEERESRLALRGMNSLSNLKFMQILCRRL